MINKTHIGILEKQMWNRSDCKQAFMYHPWIAHEVLKTMIFLNLDRHEIHEDDLLLVVVRFDFGSAYGELTTAGFDWSDFPKACNALLGAVVLGEAFGVPLGELLREPYS